MYYDSEARTTGAGDPGLPWNPFKALVAPRPIGWVTTLDAAGRVNLAPFSYFQAVADRPDVVMFSVASASEQRDGAGVITARRKDSDTNAVATGEFVCNLVSRELRESMNLTSATLPPGDSEASAAGLEMVPSRRVAPPRVATAPAALECVVVGQMPVPTRSGDHRFHMVFGEVLGVYVDDGFIDSEGRVDTGAMELVARLGYDEYAVLDEVFRMSRPDLDPVREGLVR